MASGDGEDQREFYLKVIRAIVDAFISFHGRQSALIKARKAPLDIDPDGTVRDYYGTGKGAVDVLAKQYEQFLGTSVADRQIQDAIAPHVDDEQADLLPDRLRPDMRTSTIPLFQWLRRVIDQLA